MLDTDERGLPTGTKKKTPAGLPWPRPDNTPPPCNKCPKGGPENNEALRLTGRQRAALTLYRCLGSGVQLPPEALHDGVVRAWLEVCRLATEALEARRRNEDQWVLFHLAMKKKE